MKRLLLFILLLGWASHGFAAFSYYRQIDITDGQVPSTLTDFTVLVCANSAAPCNASISGLNQSGGGAHVTQSDGDDIVFGTNSTCSSLLSWEIDSYVAATGALIAWVKISSLSDASSFFICYGDSGVTTFQGGSTGAAWDSNSKATYHLGDGSTLGLNDSTSTGLSLTNTDFTAGSGKIGGGAAIAVNGDLVTSATTVGTSVTMEAWVNVNDNTVENMFIEKSNVNASWALFNEGTMLNLRGGGSTTLSATAASSAAWHHLAGTITGTTGTIYIDGSQAATGSVNAAGNTSTAIHIGNYDNAGYYFRGTIDEVRIASAARTANWILTDYRNQSAPGTFIAFGGESSLAVRRSLMLMGVQ